MAFIVICIGIILGLLNHAMWSLQSSNETSMWGTWFMVWVVYAIMLVYVFLRRNGNK